MIVVLGRPAISVRGVGVASRPDGLVARIALAAAATGRAVELVGTIGDDGRGDELAVALGRAGVGHAALLRVAGAVTPSPDTVGEALPRLDPADVDLGLRYVPDCRVLVLAEPLAPAATAVALDAAAYHDAAVVAISGSDGAIDPALAAAATVLSPPADAESPFAELVGRYAADLDAGADPGPAFAAAARAAGWEAATGDAGEATI